MVALGCEKSVRGNKKQEQGVSLIRKGLKVRRECNGIQPSRSSMLTPRRVFEAGVKITGGTGCWETATNDPDGLGGYDYPGVSLSSAIS